MAEGNGADLTRKVLLDDIMEVMLDDIIVTGSDTEHLKNLEAGRKGSADQCAGSSWNGLSAVAMRLITMVCSRQRQRLRPCRRHHALKMSVV